MTVKREDVNSLLTRFQRVLRATPVTKRPVADVLADAILQTWEAGREDGAVWVLMRLQQVVPGFDWTLEQLTDELHIRPTVPVGGLERLNTNPKETP